MLIIPVLDLSRGLVVHAIQGERKRYRPVTSVISSSSEPESVLSAFLELYPFKIIYIADLDAIQGSANQGPLIERLSIMFNQCEFWVDAGIEAIQDETGHFKRANIKLVLGSENKLSQKSLTNILNNNPDTLLSLDFGNTGLLDNNYLLNDTRAWPKNIIVMMLHRVGLNKGVDIECLNNILKLGKNHNIYAAGGIRNLDDLKQLAKTSVSGVLVATALHNGTITQDQLHSLDNQ